MPPNVDTGEIDKFAALSPGWWDDNGPFKTLHAINPVRLRFIEQHCPLAGKKVLDVGCGGGILSETMARAGAAVTGLDAAESAIAAAGTHATQSGLRIDYRCALLENVTNEYAGQFDVISCMELLEHVPDPARLVADCASVLRPGGWAFFSTLNRTARAYFLAVLGGEYLLNLLPHGTHDYRKFIRPSELARWARANHLELKALAGQDYNPFSNTAALSHDVGINYLAACVRGA
ncbi:MAG TPA: bifunctional 2-polyprenyl-6-hydroxyphenol methylase/3-demethylubiquinol 3-O-methyltransferase UbiG [Gammaproteobacteria bacterium]|nr:bifunctional 2-polyprenyl-6-hydroxyphenol methylase/3-demethylubiquinol 3-O-methyltransferase UbiG [Gammaproteobacteria bacterium]